LDEKETADAQIVGWGAAPQSIVVVVIVVDNVGIVEVLEVVEK
jgi:hypothetical protein